MPTPPAYLPRIAADLTGNILPFWMNRALDRENGGYYGAITNDLVVDNSVPRSAVVSARILWTFSAAYAAFDDPAYLDAARHAYAYLTGPLWDAKYGGVYWSIDRAGAPVNDRKHVYAQAFAIYALSEYFRAAGEPQSLALAQDLFRQVEAASFDPLHGGNIECLSREWGPLADMRLSAKEPDSRKSMNTLLHLTEAYANLLRAWPDVLLFERLDGLLRAFLDHIIDPDAGHFRLFFDDDWRSLQSAVSFGHDIEGAWLLVDAAETLGDVDLLKTARALALHMAEAVYFQGRDGDGSIFNEADFSNPRSFEKHWWGQAEGMVGFYTAYKLSGQEHFARAAQRCWEFIETHHIDHVHGDWFKVLDRQGHPFPTQLKVGPWECPYHHARACLKMLEG